MGTLMAGALPILLFISWFAIFVGIMYLWKWNTRKKRNPLTIQLQRAPGESLQNQIRDMDLDLIIFLLFSISAPLFFLSFHLSQSYLGDEPETLFRFAINFGSMMVITLYCLHKLIKTLNERENLRLGFDAERATGQELNKLLSMGYRVFHDIPADKFNIDHVVVGENGVFAIETKGRAKRNKAGDKSEYTVTYDGQKLIFPGWTEQEPVEQVKRNAKWLSKTLSSATGDPVSVTPILSICGWYIDRKSKNPPYVYNGKDPQYLIPRISNTKLSEQQIQRIAHQIETKVSDLEPNSYKAI
ncbi:MAG: nuclease-related domain-containing protein [Gammaproteobacteria bacterium]